MTISEFLLARIVEEEEVARFVQAQQALGPWADSVGHELRHLDEYDLLYLSPSRVLAECEAKRQVVKDHSLKVRWKDELNGGWLPPSYFRDDEQPIDTDVYCHRCESCCYTDWTEKLGPCLTLRALALPYADHPDYDLAWVV